MIFNKKVLSKKIALSFWQEKLSNTISDYIKGLTKPKKLLAGAYRALREHRPSLASLFFYLSDDKYSTINVLKNKPIFSILISRLINNETLNNIIPNDPSILNNFYYYWWSNNKIESIFSLKELKIEKNDLLIIDSHRYQMIKYLGENPLNLILNIQTIPLLSYSLLLNDVQYQPNLSNPIEIPKSISIEENNNENNDDDDDLSFNFGGNIVDDEDINYSYSSSNSSSEEIEEKEININNELLNSLSINDTFLFSFNYNIEIDFIGFSKYYIISIINNLFNNNFKDLNLILKFLKNNNLNINLFNTLIFSISFNKLIFENLKLMCEEKLNINNFNLNFNNNYFNDFNENDIKLFKLLIFYKISNLYLNNEYQHYFHHRFRYLYSSQKDFNFSNLKIIEKLTIFINEPLKILKLMNDTRLTEHYRIALTDPFISPFYPSGGFSYSRTYSLPSKISSFVKDICINPINNQNIVVVGKEISDFNITQEQLNNEIQNHELESSDEWDVVNFTNENNNNNLYFDSPFIKNLEFQNQNIEPLLKPLRHFTVQWKPHQQSIFPIATCCVSHPTKENYLIGFQDGKISLSDFGSKNFKSSVKYTDNSIRQLKFNNTGDKLLINTFSGEVLISDFNEAIFVNKSINSTSLWINNDSQILISEPLFEQLSIYDTLIGEKPIIKIPTKSFLQKRIPLSINGNLISYGLGDGSLIINDLRMCKNIFNLKIHEDSIKALQFDKSGAFLITGSKDNSINILESRNFNINTKFENFLPNYNINSKKRGIKSISISNQSLITGGYSNMIHIWTMSEPNYFFF